MQTENAFSLPYVPWQDQQVSHLQAFLLALHHQQRPAGTKRRWSGHNSSRAVEGKYLTKKAKRNFYVAKAVLLIALKLKNKSKNTADLVDTWMGFCFFLWGSVQTPEGGEPALALAAGTRHGLCSASHSVFCASCHLQKHNGSVRAQSEQMACGQQSLWPHVTSHFAKTLGKHSF